MAENKPAISAHEEPFPAPFRDVDDLRLVALKWWPKTMT